MPSHFSKLFNRIVAPNLIRQFGESVTHWPSGVAADAVTISNAMVQWRSEEWDEKQGVTFSTAEAVLKLPITVVVRGSGRDTFLITDPQTDGQIKMAPLSMITKGPAWQTWTLQRLDVREIARPQYRSF